MIHQERGGSGRGASTPRSAPVGLSSISAYQLMKPRPVSGRERCSASGSPSPTPTSRAPASLAF